MQNSWPDGPGGDIYIHARARDLWTGASAARVVGAEQATIVLAPDKTIAHIDADRHRAALASFEGLRPGGQLRKAMAAQLTAEVEDATLFHRLLDELGGTSFMAGAAWFEWLPGGIEEYETAIDAPTQLNRSVEGVCVSFQAGSPALTAEGQTNHAISSHPDAPLPFRSDDPLAWHPFATIKGPSHWRIRYTDVWMEDGMVRVKAGFQDSSTLRGRTDRRMLFHEYAIDATVDPDGDRLADIEVSPGSLPFSSCLAAPASARALIGRPLRDFGAIAPALLAGVAGCTHLNEMLRSLSDAPALAAAIPLYQQTPTESMS